MYVVYLISFIVVSTSSLSSIAIFFGSCVFVSCTLSGWILFWVLHLVCLVETSILEKFSKSFLIIIVVAFFLCV